ncbi:DEAD/DEAH box helicase [Candidatus Sumerlaeota bacterium]|nr:DEAD/DEAH box helicase [Candidatus Sumerlaeota bacterium]
MPLNIAQLISYKIPPRVIDIWREQGLTELLPLQESALIETNYLRGSNLVVFAPTSSGKTFIGESVSVRVLFEQRRVIYLVPTKALAEEKFREMSALFVPLGFRVVIATSERPEADELVAQGKFDLLVAVYEKMKSYLVAHPQILAQVGLIITDELQMLGDQSRGDVVDIVLSKIRQSPYNPQIIGLSATLGDAQYIAEWLDAELLNFHKRPVELREGVYNLEDGVFYYRCFNSGEEGEEPLTSPFKTALAVNSQPLYREALQYLTRKLAEDKGEQVLIFVPTKTMSRQWALELAQQSSLPEAQQVLSELSLYEESYSRDALLSTLKHSIAFHNADLSWDLRELIEDAYDSGLIKVLFSTTTLGQGVNLTGRNVINVHQMIVADEWSGEFGFVPLTRQRFRNQGGRSARFARTTDFGRSILIGANRAEVERLLNYYIYGELESTSPPLENKALEKYVVDLVATGAFSTQEKIKDFFFSTYTGTRHWQEKSKRTKVETKIEKAIRQCIDSELIRKNEENEYSPSGIGEVVAIKGIQPLTALRFKKWVEEIIDKNLQPDVLEVLLIVSFTPDAGEFPLFCSYRERRANVYPAEIKRYLLERGRMRESLERLIAPGSGLSVTDIVAMKKTLLLTDWVSSEHSTPEIEKKYQVLTGTIRHLGMHYNWLVQSLAQISSALHASEQITRFLNHLAERLSCGVDEAGVALARLRVSGLSRTYIFNLVREGFDSPEAIANIKDIETLKRLMPSKVAEELITTAKSVVFGKKEGKFAQQKIYTGRGRSIPSTKTKKIPKRKKSTPKPKEQESPLLIIDHKEPGIVWFYGKRLSLTPLPYRLLVLLAEKAERGATYTEIDEYVWTDTKVERQQISAHKSALIKAFARVIGQKRAKKLIETRSGFGLILQLPASRIEIRK